jgi:5'-phosphate synthase pdxT subunit
MPMLAGILALQGDYAAHAAAFTRLGCDTQLVRGPEQLEGIELLAMPGGESTTMSLLLYSSGLREPLRAAIGGGLPTLATCAGVILLARRLTGDSGSIRVQPLALLDVTAGRNAYGRQVESFEAELSIDWSGLGLTDADRAYHGVFIRAPLIADCGPGVEVLASHAGSPVLVRQGNIIGAAFHPELSGDDRLHSAIAALVKSSQPRVT